LTGQLDGKVAIITGGSAGIGRGIAIAFAKEGAILVLAARDKVKLERTVKEITALGATAVAMPTDVTDEAHVLALFANTVREFQRLDILVNNAGMEIGGPLEELSLESWQQVINVNLTGVFLCSREAMRIMKPQGGGRILNIGSISGQAPRMDSVPYATSKHGVVGLTKATALEGRAFNVIASCLHPGNVMTDPADADGEETMLAVEDVAKVALTIVALPSYVNMLETVVLPVPQPYLGRG
jgi:NAD(P)-dependent dehydrogenase (short-subunit alcohol dehydrogenase family)